MRLPPKALLPSSCLKSITHTKGLQVRLGGLQHGGSTWNGPGAGPFKPPIIYWTRQPGLYCQNLSANTVERFECVCSVPVWPQTSAALCTSHKAAQQAPESSNRMQRDSFSTLSVCSTEATHQFLWTAERSADLHYVFMFCSGHVAGKYSKKHPLWALQSLTGVCVCMNVCVHPANKANCDELLIKMNTWTDTVALSGIRAGW